MDANFDQMMDDVGRELSQRKGSGLKSKVLKGAGVTALSVAAVSAVALPSLMKTEAKEEKRAKTRMDNLTSPYNSSVASNISGYKYGRHIG